MTKTLASLMLAAFAAVAFNAQAASHAGGAPMAADKAASGAKKAEMKKDEKKEEKKEAKKEEAKK